MNLSQENSRYGIQEHGCWLVNHDIALLNVFGVTHQNISLPSAGRLQAKKEKQNYKSK